MVGHLKTLGNFYPIWVVVDMLTNLDHFILVRVEYTAQHLAKVSVKEIVRLYELPLSIISNHGT